MPTVYFVLCIDEQKLQNVHITCLHTRYSFIWKLFSFQNNKRIKAREILAVAHALQLHFSLIVLRILYGIFCAHPGDTHLHDCSWQITRCARVRAASHSRCCNLLMMLILGRTKEISLAGGYRYCVCKIWITREMSVTGAHARYNNTIFHVLLYARSDKFITSYKILNDKQTTHSLKAL